MGETFSLRLEKVISGPIEEVFDAWLDPASLGRWMIPGPGGSAEAKTDPVVGGKFRIMMKLDQAEILHHGEYHVIRRPEKLVFSWNSPYSDNTLVTVDFERLSARSTRVVLTHELFPEAAVMESHRQGWGFILSGFEQDVAATKTGARDGG